MPWSSAEAPTERGECLKDGDCPLQSFPNPAHSGRKMSVVGHKPNPRGTMDVLEARQTAFLYRDLRSQAALELTGAVLGARLRSHCHQEFSAPDTQLGSGKR